MIKKIVLRCCPFQPERMKECSRTLNSTPQQDAEVDAWHQENCQCIKKGFNDFYCPHWEYSAEEQKDIDEMLELRRQQGTRRRRHD